MPKAPVDENYRLIARKYEIRLAGQTGPIEAVA